MKTTAATGMVTWDSCCRVLETMPITKEPFLPTLSWKSPSLTGQHNTTADDEDGVGVTGGHRSCLGEEPDGVSGSGMVEGVGQLSYRVGG